jgi:MraZ protein
MEANNSILADTISGVSLFVGSFQHALDTKRRLTIPAVWRAQVGTPESLYVLPDFAERCLNVIPAAEMGHKLEKLRQYSLSNAKAQTFLRKLGANSDLVSWDTQGRIRICDKLLNFAGIEDQVTMVGAFNKFQLWTPRNHPESEAIDQAELAEAGTYVDF